MRSTTKFLTRCTPVAAALVLCACSGDAYRRSADRQVRGLLYGREASVLGYQPQVELGPAGMPGRPAREDYARVPETPVAPEVPPPIEPASDEPFGPLGPPAGGAAIPEGPLDPAAGADTPDVSAVRLGGSDARTFIQGPPAPQNRPVELDLFASLRYAVQHSRDYSNRMEDLYLAALDVTLERHLFSPRPFARGGLTYTGGQADVNYRAALTATANAGIRQRLPYGGEIVAEALVNFVDALNGNVTNAESASLALSATVPLLRGAGMVNLEPLIASERELVYTVRGFENFRRDFAVAVATQYFNLLAARQSVANRVQSYSDFALLLERTQALFEADQISFLEVQRAQQSLLAAENDVSDARESYANQLDAFKILIGMPVTQELDVLPTALDVLVPEFDDGREADMVAVAEAEQFRLDLQTARDRVADARRRVEVAENGLLPDLNVSARADIANRAGTPARQIDARTAEYSAGLTLDLPIDRLPERNAYRRALIGFGQSQRDYEEAREQVAADVRTSVRAIRSARSTVRIQEQGIALARRRLEFANELLRQGDAEARDVVEAQNDLLEAQDAFEQAQSNLQVQVLRFLRNTGTLRVDPAAGAIGQAMARGPDRTNESGGGE